MQQVKLYRPSTQPSEAARPVGLSAALPASSEQPASSSAAAQAGEASSAPGPRKRKADDSSVKENVDPRPAASSSHEAGAQAEDVPGPSAAMAPPQPRVRPQVGSKRSVQLFLDLGQRDFNASRCVTCGMVYAKGQEEDERLHKAHHTSFVQGIKFQGWGRERVLLSDALKGRLIMVQATDAPAHIKKVQEVCAFVERLHGMASGWLLSVPQWKVFLYISTSKRVVGVAVVEPIKQAYRVAATAGQEVESRGQQPVAGSGAAQADVADTAATGATASRQQARTSSAQQPAQQQQHHQQQHRHKFTWRSRSSSQAASDPSLRLPGSSSAGTSSHMAGSRPSSLLQAAGGLHMSASADTMSVMAASASTGLHAMPAASASAAVAAAASAGKAPGDASMGGDMIAAVPATGAAGHEQCDAAAAPGTSQAGPMAALPQHPTAAGLAAPPQRPSAAGRAMPMADKSRAVKALAGVRMVWVSSEQRRQGMATKLLDAARCNVVLGFVVPRQQMAFTQPTELGVRMARSYTGTEAFLVYGLS